MTQRFVKSPMPFGCLPIRQGGIWFIRCGRYRLSPMPFGCLPIRQDLIARVDAMPLNTGLQCLSAVCLSGRWAFLLGYLGDYPVSNAFRLSVYPADLIIQAGPGSGKTSPMPFGCLPIRQTSSRRGRQCAARPCLQCLSAVCLSGSHETAFAIDSSSLGLQCLSAVCLSGSGKTES